MGVDVSITFREKSFYLIYMRIMYKKPSTFYTFYTQNPFKGFPAKGLGKGYRGWGIFWRGEADKKTASPRKP
jgi:hypothetical protein